MFRSAWLLGSVIALACATQAKADDGAPGREVLLDKALRQAVKKAEPSIVCVLVSRSELYTKYGKISADEPGKLGGFDPHGDAALRALDMSSADFVPESYGSGIVIAARERLILTNYHVVRDATKVYLRLSGSRSGYANIYAADPRSDLAVLQLIPALELPAEMEIQFGDGGKVEKGQLVVALSHPFAAGFRDGGASASFGILSNTNHPTPVIPREDDRARLTLAQFGRLIEHDARVTLGSSGGALVDLHGELIGISNTVATLTGVDTPGGFALPLDDNIKAIIEVLKRGQEVEYGFLGVRLDPNLRNGRVYQIASAIGNSPAQAAGLGERTCIHSINDVRIHDSNDLFFNIGIALAGSKVKLTVSDRPGAPSRTVEVTLVKSYVPGKVIAAKRPDAKQYGGLRVDYASVLIQRKSWPPYEPIPQGVAIREVLEGSPAARALLQEDKVITHVNGKAVHHPSDFYRQMDAAREAKAVELTIMNVGDKPYQVKLELP